MRSVQTKLIIFIVGIVAVMAMVNACKKEKPEAALVTYLVRANSNGWQLASLQRLHFNGDTLKSTDTLNTTCNFTQSVKFNADGSYSYNYFSCLNQKTNGTWAFTPDYLVLRSPTLFKDTSVTLKRPFKYARIINLGQNSLVLQQTDTLTKDTAKAVLIKRTTVTRYGFIGI